MQVERSGANFNLEEGGLVGLIDKETLCKGWRETGKLVTWISRESVSATAVALKRQHCRSLEKERGEE